MRGDGELGDMPQSLALRTKVVLFGRFESFRVGEQRPQLLQPRLGGGRIAAQLVVRAPRCGELAPGAAGRACRVGGAGEGVERRQLIGGPGEPPLLELAAHRKQRLDRGRHVLPRGAPAPGIGARPPVGEDPPREDERLLAFRPELCELTEGLVVGQVELRLDIGLVRGRPDQRGLALRTEQKADRPRRGSSSRPRFRR